MALNSNERRAVVIGAGLGGLSAAIHLRLAGWDVTILEQQARPGGRANLIEADGFRFDTGPSLLNYPWVFEELFAAAGRRLADYVTLLPVDPSIHFRWLDGARLTLSSNLQRLQQECARLEPEVAPGLLAFLADAEIKYRFALHKLAVSNRTNPAAWFLQLAPAELLRSGVWRSLEGELRRFFRSAKLRAALGSYAMYLGGSPWQLPGLFSILPYGELAHGLWLPRGGMYALVEALAKLAGELGVSLRFRQQVRRIRLQAGRAAGVEQADGSVLEASAVVSNVDVPTTLAQLLPGTPPRRGNNLLRRPPVMTPGVITFYWGVRGTLPGWGHHTIFLPADPRRAYDELLAEQVPADLPFYVAVPSATDPGLAPPGCQAVFALAPVPTLARPRDWAATVAEVRARIRRRLSNEGFALGPDQLVLERVFTPEDWQRQFGLFQGSAFGAAHRLWQLGPFRDRNFDPRIPGLYYVGAGVPPGTGVPITVLGGRMTAQRMQEHVLG